MSHAHYSEQVITEAFDNQIADRGQADGSEIPANAQRAEDVERAKAG